MANPKYTRSKARLCYGSLPSCCAPRALWHKAQWTNVDELETIFEVAG